MYQVRAISQKCTEDYNISKPHKHIVIKSSNPFKLEVQFIPNVCCTSCIRKEELTT